MGNKRLLRSIAGIVLSVVIFYYLFEQLVSYWHQVEVHSFSFRYPYLGLSILCLLSFFALSAKGWHLTVRILGGNLSFYRAMFISTYAQFGKYIPGKVWSVVGKTCLSERYGLSREMAIKSISLEFLFAHTTGLFLFALYQIKHPVFPLATLGYIWGAVLASALLIMHPFLANRAVAIIAKILHYDITPFDFRTKHTIGLFVFYSSSWLLLGLSLFFLMASFSKVSPNLFFPVSCIFPFANTSGAMVIVVPGGLGIREGVLSYLLKPILGASASVLFALISRMWTTIGEVLVFIIIFMINRNSRKL